MLDVSWPFPRKFSLWYKIKSRFVVGLVGTFSKIVCVKLNNTHVHNKEILTDLIHRNKNQPLITVSNHYSCMDDPLLWGILDLFDLVRHYTLLRWVPSASEISFSRKSHAKFFALGQCIPVDRGLGVYQKGMDYALDKLNDGLWVHMFVEGGVNMTKEVIRLKWGVGRLIYECIDHPIVIPIWAVGMDSILPTKKPYIPRIGQNVTINIGKPIDIADTVKMLKQSNECPTMARKNITDIIQEELYRHKKETELLHFQKFKT